MPLGKGNEQIKRLRKLVEKPSFRQTERAFVVEGPRAIEAAIAARADLEAIYFGTNLHPRHAPFIKRAYELGYSLFEVDAGVLEPVLDLSHAQPIAAIAAMPPMRPIGFDSNAPIVVLDQLRDPGNAGTIIRSAHASGSRDVIFLGGSVDPYNAKVVRSSAGSVFFVNIHQDLSVDATIAQIKAGGFRLVGAIASAETPYSQAAIANSVAFVIGNEADGISDEVASRLDLSVRIPTETSLESLNASMAATILLFESRRQRFDG